MKYYESLECLCNTYRDAIINKSDAFNLGFDSVGVAKKKANSNYINIVPDFSGEMFEGTQLHIMNFEINISIKYTKEVFDRIFAAANVAAIIQRVTELCGLTYDGHVDNDFFIQQDVVKQTDYQLTCKSHGLYWNNPK